MDYIQPSHPSGSITVLLHGGKDKLVATDFQVLHGILELTNAGRPILSHAIRADIHPPEFWTNETDGPRALAWTVDVEVLRQGSRRTDRPIYVFSNQALYEQFQTIIRRATFIKEFTADSIKPNGKGTNLHSSIDCNVKIWERPGSLTRYITLPFTSRNETVNEVLDCAWLDPIDGKTSTVTHLKFKVNRGRANSRAHSRTASFGSSGASKISKGLARAGSWISSKRPTLPEQPVEAGDDSLDETERPPLAVLSQITEIVLTFKDATARLNFSEEVRMHSKPMSPSISHYASPGAERDTTLRPDAGSPSNGHSRAPSTGGVSPTTLQSTPPTTEPPSAAMNQSSLPRAEYEWSSLPEPMVPRPPVGTGLGVSITPLSSSPLTPGLHPDAAASGSFLTAPAMAQSPPRSRSIAPPYRPPPSPNLTAQQQLDERNRFCMRQTDVAPISKSARSRAQSNRVFYDGPLSVKHDIRLLHIAAGRDGELELRLEGKSLEEAAGTYEALSYSWGSGTDLVGVTLENGRKREKKFLVSKHLDQALRRLRLVDEQRTVWIDAICINQADVKEMNHQVPLMGQIYRRAKRTIIWIAEFEKTAEQPTCIRNFPAEDDDTEDSCTLCAKFDGTALEHGDLDTKLKSLLSDFHQRIEAAGSGDAWYLRLWCVQEFHFSQKLPSVYLGQHAIGWQHFATLFKKVIGDFGPMVLFEQLRSQEQRTMHSLCATTGPFRVSDPRDRVYSLLNMTDDHPMKVKPDYAKSILEVLEEVVLYLVQESQTVDVLLDKRCDRTFGDGYGIGVLPTYMPDLTKLQSAFMSKGMDQYYTGNKKPPAVELCDDDEYDDLPLYPGAVIPRILLMKGIRFDTIKHFTTVDDIPHHEISPSGALIYNSLSKPGELIRTILEALHFKWEDVMMKHDVDRTPKIGRLILEFLFEEQRNHLEELSRCNDRSGTNLKALFKVQAEADQRYVREEDENEGDRNLSDDLDFIMEHWTQRKNYISSESPGRLDITKMLDIEQSPWREALSYDESVCRDFQAATEFENLFCYARRTHNKYYFSGQNYHQPMRRNVLDAKTMEDILELETEFGRDSKFELHEYSDKARQKDFFATAGGFVGLGPTGMRRGDVLVVPYSASRPFVLRPCRGKDGYTLVGEAVMPGVMHGQWVRNNEKLAQYYKLR